MVRLKGLKNRDDWDCTAVVQGDYQGKMIEEME